MRLLLSFAGLFIGLSVIAQPGWNWTPLPDMPEPVANNAVVEAYSGDTLCVYSFCGIDSSKEYSGIHLKTFKYNTLSQEWTQLADAPDSLGKIATGASVIDNIIYLVGGYYVFENNTELSSNKVHRFDPETDSWLEDAAPIPVQIDDQVQTVYRDSLIYVITGWSDVNNVSDVQIYDPFFDTWMEGTSLSNSLSWKAFGASGAIVGDSVFYHGGVNSTAFNATSRLRKGAINPENPLEIEWDLMEDSPGDDGYRAACMTYEDRIFWVGGSGISYNFDGISYASNEGVPPLYRIATYYSGQALWEEGLGSPYGVMDMRGIAKVSDASWIICGGMEEEQQVSQKTFLLELNPTVSVPNSKLPIPGFYQNSSVVGWNLEVSERCYYEVISSEGKVVASDFSDTGAFEINLSSLKAGCYILSVKGGIHHWSQKFILN